ncbi:hypothetical protein [Azospirillum sp. TSO22-1]|uniref:hypothetical protein n=1 Tax=Azospirillum sp. TSO22-1 TaxID=716789 RepID=UPI000D614C0B|nr:hypothetical protein [Azospirillum sp. TSO22-1]PWC53618.1 hypothetical protein TSO221_10340 [Azospirillum sp. TSO22-1]
MPSGGGGSTSTTQQVFPEWYSGPMQQVMGYAQGAAGQPYSPVPFQRIAEFTPDQQTAFDMVRKASSNGRPTMEAARQTMVEAGAMSGMQTALPYFTQAAGMSGAAAASPMLTAGANTDAAGAASPWVTQGMNASSAGAANPLVSQGTGRFVDSVDDYMSPYTDKVVDRIAQLGQRNLTENLLPAVNDTFIEAGQFGGKRNAEFTNRAIRDANESILGQQAQALESGWATSGQLYGADAARQVQGGLGLGALAGQDAGRQIQGGLGLGQLTDANARRQIDAGTTLGNLTGQDANRLASIGQQAGALVNADAARKLETGRALTDFVGKNQDIQLRDAAAMAGIGQQQQGMDQKNIDLALQDFQSQRDYPWTQLNRWSGLLSNARPPGSSTTTSQGPDTTGKDMASLGMSAAMMAAMFLKKGGLVRPRQRLARGGLAQGAAQARSARTLGMLPRSRYAAGGTVGQIDLGQGQQPPGVMYDAIPGAQAPAQAASPGYPVPQPLPEGFNPKTYGFGGEHQFFQPQSLALATSAPSFNQQSLEQMIAGIMQQYAPRGMNGLGFGSGDGGSDSDGGDADGTGGASSDGGGPDGGSGGEGYALGGLVAARGARSYARGGLAQGAMAQFFEGGMVDPDLFMSMGPEEMLAADIAAQDAMGGPLADAALSDAYPDALPFDDPSQATGAPGTLLPNGQTAPPIPGRKPRAPMSRKDRMKWLLPLMLGSGAMGGKGALPYAGLALMGAGGLGASGAFGDDGWLMSKLGSLGMGSGNSGGQGTQGMTTVPRYARGGLALGRAYAEGGMVVDWATQPEDILSAAAGNGDPDAQAELTRRYGGISDPGGQSLFTKRGFVPEIKGWIGRNVQIGDFTPGNAFESNTSVEMPGDEDGGLLGMGGLPETYEGARMADRVGRVAGAWAGGGLRAGREVAAQPDLDRTDWEFRDFAGAYPGADELPAGGLAQGVPTGSGGVPGAVNQDAEQELRAAMDAERPVGGLPGPQFGPVPGPSIDVKPRLPAKTVSFGGGLPVPAAPPSMAPAAMSGAPAGGLAMGAAESGKEPGFMDKLTEAMSNPLVQAAFGMMASRNPSIAGALGEGLSGASRNMMANRLHQRQMDIAERNARSNETFRNKQLTNEERRLALAERGDGALPAQAQLVNFLMQGGRSRQEAEDMVFSTKADPYKKVHLLNETIKSAVEHLGMTPEEARKYAERLIDTTAPARAGGGERPPVAGAQKAPDGKWYVKQGDKWARVEMGGANAVKPLTSAGADRQDRAP